MNAPHERSPKFLEYAAALDRHKDSTPLGTGIGLTYDDVIIIPGHSEITTLDAVSTETRLVKGIDMYIPIVSANMDSVTEAPMAEFIARAGGIGILHRGMTIDEEVRQVKAVKDAMKLIVDDPPVLSPDDSVEKARAIMEERQRGFIIILDDQEQLTGLVTTRDVHRRAPIDAPLSLVMTRRDQIIHAKPGISMEAAQEMMYKARVEKLPLIDSDGVLRGVITDRDIRMTEEFRHATKDEQGRLRVGAAIGVQAESLERAQALINAGVDVLVIDVLHGDTKTVARLTEQVKKLSPTVPVIAGNVGSGASTLNLINAGADGVKVGYGPGGVCTTQGTTGTGRAQLTGVIESSAAAWKANKDVTIIADGGIRSSGDIAKAIGAGASSTMLGSLLAGTDESPGEILMDKNGLLVKEYRGMASAAAQEDLARARGATPKNRAPQGITIQVPYKGGAEKIVHLLREGYISGMANAGAEDPIGFQDVVIFEQRSPAGQIEGTPHAKR